MWPVCGYTVQHPAGKPRPGKIVSAHAKQTCALHNILQMKTVFNNISLQYGTGLLPESALDALMLKDFHLQQTDGCRQTKTAGQDGNVAANELHDNGMLYGRVDRHALEHSLKWQQHSSLT